MAFLSEAAVELALLNQLRGLGYSIEREEDIGPDTPPKNRCETRHTDGIPEAMPPKDP